MKLFLQKGYEQTTIQDIVDQLGGLTRGAVYHHFKSKEDIMDAAFTKVFQENDWLGEVRKEKGLSGLERLRKFLLFFCTDIQYQEMNRIAIPLAKNPKVVMEMLQESMQKTAPMLRGFIEEGIADGSIRQQNASAAAEVIVLLLNFWVSPVFVALDLEYMMERLCYLQEICDAMGIALVNTEFKNAYCDCIENLLKK